MNALASYLELCKVRVILLMLVTAVVGMLIAATPDQTPWLAITLGNVGIAFCAGSAAVINHIVERHIDIKMLRTQNRPVAQGRISQKNALLFSLILGICGSTILVVFINNLTAILTLASLLGYALFYTIFLKKTTPQNIVIGGLAGAAPPLLGQTAVTGTIEPIGLILVLIIFAWTPPHFWALAIFRKEDYVKSGLPMLPVTHGTKFTKLCIVLYTIILLPISIMPFVIRQASYGYLLASLALGAIFLYHTLKLYIAEENQQNLQAIETFKFSITYLMLLFLCLLGDHYLTAHYLTAENLTALNL